MFPLPLFPWLRRWFGSRSERQAERFLRRLGYRIITHNWTCPLGELDIIARDGNCVVFVEVRSTSAGDSSRPAESVDHRKQHKLTQVALSFLQQHRLLQHPARFDVVTLHWPEGKATPEITHHQNAFEATGMWQMFS